MNKAQLDLLQEQTAPTAIAGLTCIPEYIDRQSEAALIHIIDQQSWLSDLKRRVQHYGYRYDYQARNVTPELKLGSLPDWLSFYCSRLYEDRLFPTIPDQVILNEYQPGQGISSHIDCVPCFTETIASLSLGSACVMDFMNSKTQEKCSILLKPRSLLILSSDARYNWKHSIAQRKTDRFNGVVIPRDRRISLTFRKVIMADG